MSRIPQATQQRNARLAPHLMYICPECGKGFRAQKDWRTHLNTKHQYEKKTIEDFNFKKVAERFHECQICFKWVASETHTLALIQYHRFMHLPFPQTYRCLHCRSAYSRRRALNDHLEEKHTREINQYEARVQASKLKQQNQVQTKPPVIKEDIIRKALFNSQIDLGPENSIVANRNNHGETNPSEAALDRSLSALEEILRQEKEKSCTALNKTPQNVSSQKNVFSKKSIDHSAQRDINESVDDEEMEQLCDEFFKEVSAAENHLGNSVKSEKNESPMKESLVTDNENQVNEFITIQIDALDKEEVELLQQKSPETEKKPLSKPENDRTHSGSRKRKRQCLTSEEYELELEKEMSRYIKYVCPECAKEFPTESDWRNHVFMIHDFANISTNKFKTSKDMKSSKCLSCSEILNSTKKPELMRHYFLHLPFRSYLKCSLCLRSKTNTSKILNHIRYNHRDKLKLSFDIEDVEDESKMELKCNWCNKDFKFQEKLIKHSRECERKSVAKQKSNVLDEGYKQLLEHLNGAKERMRLIRDSGTY